MKIKILLFSLSICSFLQTGCKKEVAPVVIEQPDTPYLLDYGNLPEPNLPLDNPLTREGVRLGRILFYEKLLSSNNKISCASCHMQKYAFSDTAAFSTGIDNLKGKRNAMSVFNMAWNSNHFFWDGRAELLRHQSLMPIQDPLEMNETLANVIKKLQSVYYYKALFKKAFGTEEINETLISHALEQFMNSIVSSNSKYDDFLAGKVSLSAVEERGRFLFFTEYNPSFPANSGADCKHCHGGNNFENDKYMNNGLDTDAGMIDLGRQLVTSLASDKGKFKVPSLRNIALTAPYMHDGRFKTLEEVINNYNLVKTSSTLDPSFQQQLPNGLQLSTADKQALVAFLNTLTDPVLISKEEYSNPFTP